MEVRKPVDAVIEVTNLTCRYRRHEAVHGISFAVGAGTFFGMLGPNGAGKTTTIRALMNILRPSGGEARLFGVDSRRLGPRELQTIGYVSENQEIPGWMTVAELLAYCKPFYPTWDDDLCRKLLADLALPANVKIGRLSRGMRVKAALISALAYRPRLLVLDEPFSGLDPVVREDLVHGVLERAGEEQWSVFISSHDLDEVERLVDDVAFLDAGRLVLSESFETLQQRFRRVEVTTSEPPSSLSATAPSGWIGMTAAGRVIRFVDSAYSEPATGAEIQSRFPGARVDVQPMTLREIFVALARQTRGAEAREARS
jgi:ABC-2 type transport system ATP-binding protein